RRRRAANSPCHERRRERTWWHLQCRARDRTHADRRNVPLQAAGRTRADAGCETGFRSIRAFQSRPGSAAVILARGRRQIRSRFVIINRKHRIQGTEDMTHLPKIITSRRHLLLGAGAGAVALAAPAIWSPSRAAGKRIVV